MSKTNVTAEVSSDTCNVNGYDDRTYRIRKDKDNKSYIKILGERVDLVTSPQEVKLELGVFKVKFDPSVLAT